MSIRRENNVPRSRRESTRRLARKLGVETLESRRLLTAQVSEYPLDTTGGPSEYVTLGPDNDIWMTLASNNIGQLNTTTGVINQYPIPSPNSSPGAIITGPDKNLWFIENATNQLGVVNPSTGAITEVPVLADGASQIQDLVVGPDGNIWFTEYKANKIGEINPTTHVVEEFSITTPNSEPYDITSADGDLWFTEAGANQIGMINPTTHTITPFAIPSTGNDEAEGIALGSDGNLWFTETAANAIGKLIPTTGAFTIYNTGLSSNAGLSEITKGSDGNLWFTEPGSNGIGKIIPSTGVISQYSSEDANAPTLGIATGSDGNLYYGITSTDNYGKITTAGSASEIGIPLTYSFTPLGITEGQDGSLWFADSIGNDEGSEVGVVNPTTHFSTEYLLSSHDNSLRQIALDPLNGTLWFTDPGNIYLYPDEIGTINPTTRQHNEIPLPASESLGIQGITFDQSEFYFAEQSGNTIGSINPSNDTIVDSLVTLPSGSDPYGITADSSGNLWFSDYGTGNVDEYNPTTQVLTPITLNTGSKPEGITVGPDGNIWVVETGTSDIAVINSTTDHVITQTTATSATGSITTGPDNELWFTESTGIGRITTSGYVVTSYPVANATPEGVASGPDGNLWFTGAGVGNSPNITGTVDLASAATATKVAITTQPPSDVTATKGFGLVATVENASGSADTYFHGTVTITPGSNSGGSTLSGTKTATAVNGVATFPGLSLNNPGTGYTIVASSTGLTSATTNAFTVSNAATHLVITSQPPGSVSATSPFSVTIAAEDASGNIDPSYNSTLSLAIGNNPGASTLSGTTSLGANAGVVTFSGLSLNNPGSDYTLLASDPSSILQGSATAGFNVTPPPATQLMVVTEPPLGVVAGATFSLVISAVNNSDQVDTTNNSTVTLTLGGGASGATLGGSLTMQFVAGVATFSGLSINLVSGNTPYTITATDSSLISPTITTTTISVFPGTASSFTVTPLVSNAIAGVAFPVKVSALDAFGNVATTYTGTIHFSSTDSKFTPPADYTYLTSDQGTHVFQVTLKTLGSQTLTVTDDSNSSEIGSTSIQVNPPTATVTTLMVSTASLVVGQSVTLKATVAQDNSTGTVTFLDGSTVLATEPLTSTGASYSTSLPLGGNSLTAKYSGSTDGTLASSVSTPVSLTVGKFSTGASVTASATTTTLGQSVILTALIKAVSPGAGTPTGSVTFLDGTATLGTVTLDPTGHATLTVPKLGLGTNSITISYTGDANGTASKSAAIQVYVGDLVDDDFDGDGKADIAVFGFSPTYSKYGLTILTSSSGFTKTTFFDNNGYGYGNASSIPVIGDYFGDGRDDYALWTPNSLGGMTFTAVSPVSGKGVTVNFGETTDIPVVADVDGDGKDDFGVYGYQQGLGWRFDFLLSSYNFASTAQDVFNNNGYGYGNSTSIPVVGDFDGSGKAGFGVYTPSTAGSTFAFVDPSTNFSILKTISPSLGTVKDIPMAVDYDGDGKADLALYGPDPAHAGQYRYLVLTDASGFNPSAAVTFNNNGYGYGNSYSTPVMANYDGTGKDDFAVFTPDFNGGEEYVYQTNQTGAGVIEDFPGSTTAIPLTASPYLLAKKVRGS